MAEKRRKSRRRKSIVVVSAALLGNSFLSTLARCCRLDGCAALMNQLGTVLEEAQGAQGGSRGDACAHSVYCTLRRSQCMPVSTHAVRVLAVVRVSLMALTVGWDVHPRQAHQRPRDDLAQIFGHQDVVHRHFRVILASWSCQAGNVG
eukprot:965635-Rhodomonas_salina.3